MLVGLVAGILLALGFSRACDRLAGGKAYRYLGSGSPGRRAEDGLWRDAERRLDRSIDVLGNVKDRGEGD